MAENSIASGSVVLTATADPMIAKLKAAERDVKSAAERMNHHLTSEIGKIGKKGGLLSEIGADFLGGGMMGPGALGGTAALVAGVTLAAHEFSDVIGDWFKGIDRANESLSETETMLQRFEKHMTDSAKISDEWQQAMATPEDKVSAIETEMADAVARREKLVKALALANYQANETNFKSKQDIYRKAAEETSAAIDKIDARLDELRTRRDRAENPAKDPAFIGAINQATAAIDKQIATWGLAGTAAQRALLVLGGGTDELLAKFDKKAAEYKALQDAAEEHARSVERSTLTRSTNPLLETLDRILRDPARLDKMEYNERAGSASMGRLGSMLAMGMSASGKALKPILDQLGAKSPANDFASAVEANSKEAYSLRIRNQFPGASPGGQPNKVEDAKLRQGVDQMNSRLDQIRDAIRGALGGIGVV